MTTVRSQWLTRTAIAALTALGALAALTLGWFEPLELPVRDAALRTIESLPARSTVVVAIDQESLDRIGPWPWPRAQLGRLVREIRENDPKTIAVDLLLIDPSTDDATLSETLDPSDTILAAALTAEGTWVLPAPDLRARTLSAHASLDVDHDGVLRRLTSTRQTRDLSLPAISVLAASLQEPSRPVPVSRQVVPDFSIRPVNIPQISAADLLNGKTDAVRNRIVFIGVTALGLGDRAMTPVSDAPVPGVLIHAAITEALLADRLLMTAPPWIAALMAGAIVIMALGLMTLGRWRRITLELTLIGSPLIGGFLLLRHQNLAIPIVTLTIVSLVAVLVIEIRAAFFTAYGAAHAEAFLDPLAVDRGTALGPEERVRRLMKIAQTVGEERVESSQSRKVLAHELKTPLTSVRGLAQILAGFELSESETRRVANLMVTETTRLHSLIERILDIERIHLEPYATCAKPSNLSKLVSERVEILRGNASHPISAEISPLLQARGRPELLELVVDNLIGNAMKFSEPGSSIDVRLQRDASNLILEVEDRGPGIPPEERETIFRRFARGSTSRGTDGMGLGLSLVQEIVAWHQGSIQVVPARFRGSIFRVTLPAMTASREAAS